MVAYPTFNAGIVTQRPYTVATRYKTSGVDMETGRRHAYHWLANPLLRWELSHSVMTDSELVTLETFFDSMGGRYGQFDFDDPDTLITHTNCRFGMDALEIEHLGPNHNSVRVVIEEYT